MTNTTLMNSSIIRSMHHLQKISHQYLHHFPIVITKKRTKKRQKIQNSDQHNPFTAIKTDNTYHQISQFLFERCFRIIVKSWYNFFENTASCESHYKERNGKAQKQNKIMIYEYNKCHKIQQIESNIPLDILSSKALSSNS